MKDLSLRVALRVVAAANPPNWKRPLKAYKNGWADAIAATVIASDQHGPTLIAWMGHTYTRLCGTNPKYGAAIWFSRAIGKSEDGETAYTRLITFEDSAAAAAEPLPAYVVEKLK